MLLSASMAPPFKILSVDGGGIRGIIPAQILVAIEERTGRPICELFDFLARAVPWQEERMHMYDRTVRVPRLVARYRMGREGYVRFLLGARSISDVLRRRRIEPAKERVGLFAGVAEEVELGLAPGDAEHGDELNLVVARQRAEGDALQVVALIRKGTVVPLTVVSPVLTLDGTRLVCPGARMSSAAREQLLLGIVHQFWVIG